MQTLVKEDETKYWNEEFEKCKRLRDPYEKQWYLNLAFYSGKQYVSWSPNAGANLSTQRLQEPPAPRYRVRIVANKIKPAVRTELTKLCKQEPQFYSVPATPEPNDVSAAKAGEAIVEYLLTECEFNRVRRKATWWALICGVAYTKTYAVPKPAPEPTLDLMGPSKYEFVNNIRLDYVTAFHIYIPNPQEQDLEKQPYVIHARSYSADQIKALYGVDIPPKERMAAGQLEQKFQAAIGIKAGTSPAPDMCFVKEIWIKPCKRYPEGGLLVYAEDTLVYAYTETEVEEDAVPVMGKKFTDTSFPYKHNKYPYDKIEHVDSGSFYATSTIEDLISLQKEYNRTRSQIVEAKNRMGNPQMWYNKGALDPKKVTSEPGLMIPVNPGFSGPQPIQMESIPGYVIQELDRTLRDMDDLTGQYEVSKGRTPPGVEAASAIAYLQEENDSKLYTTVASIEEATRGIGRKILSLVQEYWTEEDITHIISRNSSFEAALFKMADMESNSDIRVEPGSMAPKSKAATQAFITDLISQGIIPPEKGLKYLQMNETNRLYDELQADAKAAQREDYKMANGLTEGALPVNIWDNIPVHLNEHGLFLKSQAFEMLPDELKKLHIEHYFLHKQAELGEMYGPGTAVPNSADSAAGEPQPEQQQFPGV